jgi:hypothetical protein
MFSIHIRVCQIWGLISLGCDITAILNCLSVVVVYLRKTICTCNDNWSQEKESGAKCCSEVFAVLGNCTALFGSELPMSWDSLLIPPLRIQTLADGSNRLPQNIGNYQSVLRNIPSHKLVLCFTYVKVRSNVCMHAMKTYRGSISTHLNLSTRWKWMVNYMLWLLYPHGQNPLLPV